MKGVLRKLKPEVIYWEIVRPNMLNFLLGKPMLTMSRTLFKFKRFIFLKNRRVLNLFIAADDVQSFVLLQCIRQIIEAYDVDVKINVLEPQINGWSSGLDVKYDWVFRDSNLFCALYGLEHPARPSRSLQCLDMVTSMLVNVATSKTTSRNVEDATAVLKLAWNCPSRISKASQGGLASTDVVASELRSNKSLLKRLGYYNPGAVEYEGEWYPPGRLHHLERRLQNEFPGINCPLLFDKELESPISVLSQRASTTPLFYQSEDTNVRQVELFYSFRSPYSQLVLPRLRPMCEAFNVQVVIRPVLPMVTRGLKVPLEKELYIGRDAAREARLFGLRMGKIADPCNAALLHYLFC